MGVEEPERNRCGKSVEGGRGVNGQSWALTRGLGFGVQYQIIERLGEWQQPTDTIGTHK